MGSMSPSEVCGKDKDFACMIHQYIDPMFKMFVHLSEASRSFSVRVFHFHDV